jgi:hypothetical protein
MTKTGLRDDYLGVLLQPEKIRYSRYGYENLVDRARQRGYLRQRLSNYRFTLKTARFKDRRVVGGFSENIGLLENIGDALIADTERAATSISTCVFSVNDWEMYVCVEICEL